MTEKPYLISLIDAYSEANDRGGLKTLKESLSNYELTNEERGEIERLIEKGLGEPEVHEKPVSEALPFLEELVKNGVYPTIREAVEEFKTRRERRLSTPSPPESSASNHEAKIAEILVTLKTNPDGISDALEEAISPAMREKLGELIRARLERKGLIEAIDWGDNVKDFLERCEEQGGVPMFRTRYLGRFEDREHPGKYLVLFICYNKKWSQWFNNVSLEDIERLELE